MAKAKIKMKYWKRPVEKKEELEKVENKSLDEILNKYRDDYNLAKFSNQEDGFKHGFLKAKSMIIEFLSQKSLGYNDAYFFKMRDIEALGEPDKISDETMTEKDRVAQWDWAGQKDEENTL